MKKLLAFLTITVLCFIVFSQPAMAVWPWGDAGEHNWKAYTDTFTVLNSATDTSATYTIGDVVYIGGIYNLTKAGGDSCKGQVVAQVSNDGSAWARVDSVSCTVATTAAVKTLKNWSSTLAPFLYVRFLFQELIAATDTGAVGVDLLLKE